MVKQGYQITKLAQYEAIPDDWRCKYCNRSKDETVMSVSLRRGRPDVRRVCNKCRYLKGKSKMRLYRNHFMLICGLDNTEGSGLFQMLTNQNVPSSFDIMVVSHGTYHVKKKIHSFDLEEALEFSKEFIKTVTTVRRTVKWRQLIDSLEMILANYFNPYVETGLKERIYELCVSKPYQRKARKKHVAMKQMRQLDFCRRWNREMVWN